MFFFFYFVLRDCFCQIIKLEQMLVAEVDSDWQKQIVPLWYVVVDTLGKKEWQRIRLFLSDEKWHFMLISLTSAEGWKVEILKALAFIGLQAG